MPGFWGARPKVLSPALSLLGPHFPLRSPPGCTLPPRQLSYPSLPRPIQTNEMEPPRSNTVGPERCPLLPKCHLAWAFSLVSCYRSSLAHACLTQSQGQLPREKLQSCLVLARTHSVAPLLPGEGQPRHRHFWSCTSWPVKPVLDQGPPSNLPHKGHELFLNIPPTFPPVTSSPCAHLLKCLTSHRTELKCHLDRGSSLDSLFFLTNSHHTPSPSRSSEGDLSCLEFLGFPISMQGK